MKMKISTEDHDYPGIPHTKMITGRYANVLEPETIQFDARDIAHALSNVCRFGGRCKRFYSVAEHCIYVSNMLFRLTGDRTLALAGLLHDASEAYIGDVIHPLKQTALMGEYRALEEDYMFYIAKWVGIPHETFSDPRLLKVDKELQAWEMAIVRDTDLNISPKPEDIRKEFISLFHKRNYL